MQALSVMSVTLKTDIILQQKILMNVVPWHYILYSGLFSWVEIFVKSWKRLPELNFVVLRLRSTSSNPVKCIQLPVVYISNALEHTERILLSTSEKDGTLQCRVLRERRVSQARPNQPQRWSLSGYYLHWGWLDLAGVGWVLLARLRKRLPRLQRHLGG